MPSLSKAFRSESVGNEDFKIPLFGKTTMSARMMRSESLYVPPTISESLIEKTVKNIHKEDFDHSAYIKDRGLMRSMISAGLIQEARELLQVNLTDIFSSSIKIRGYLDALEFL